MKNKKIKIIIIVGARPNFIKIAPLFKYFKKYSKRVMPIIVHTGQHYDNLMSRVFFKELNIPKPKYDLGVGSGLHGQQTGKILIKLEGVYLKENPDLVVVVGDVNSTLAGALAAVKIHIPVAHIEAGVRSYDKSMPEEINRIVTDRVADILLCPTQNAVRNLKKEAITKGVFNVGDLNYDSFLNKLRTAHQKSKILNELRLAPKKYYLLTIHRPANVDNLDNFKNIIKTIVDSRTNVVFPVHPRTKKQLEKLKIKEFKNLKLIDPVGYLDMLILEESALKIITDSGGVQKEAYFLKTPCITLRDCTEWTETMIGGWNILVCRNNIPKLQKIIKSPCRPKKYQRFFGDGRAAEKIVKILSNSRRFS